MAVCNDDFRTMKIRIGSEVVYWQGGISKTAKVTEIMLSQLSGDKHVHWAKLDRKDDLVVNAVMSDGGFAAGADTIEEVLKY